jgi:DNA-binding transcriptional MerR regulator
VDADGRGKKSVKSYQSREFALRAGVTVRALHHYDRLGLLKPSRRSRAGYRLYSDLVRLEQVGGLKSIGLPLKELAPLLGKERNALRDGPAWKTLVAGFTGGDPEIQKGLNNMYADMPNWPAARREAFQTGFGIRPEIQEFMRKAMKTSG